MDSHLIEKLVIASRNGDKSAYAHLIGLHYKSVYLMCRGLLGSEHDAQDIAQESLLAGFINIGKLRRSDRFGSWLGTIARNLCINYLRKKKPIIGLPETAAGQQDKDMTYRDLQQAIDQLPAELRAPLMMYYIDGYNVRDVAEKLNISPSGVYLKLRTATKMLHTILIGHGETK